MTKEQIKEKLKIYLDKNDFKIPTFVDMVNFAQEIATEATKELQKENAKLQAKIDDWQSEYIELENFKNNEIAELKAQIEKLKCCENCKHHCFWGNELNCRTLSYDEELECMKTKSRWEEIKDESN